MLKHNVNQKRAVCKIAFWNSRFLGREAARSPRHASPIWHPDLDVLVPARRTVVLQADVADAGVVFVGDVELVKRPIRATVGGCPLVEVHPSDELAV